LGNLPRHLTTASRPLRSVRAVTRAAGPRNRGRRLPRPINPTPRPPPGRRAAAAAGEPAPPWSVSGYPRDPSARHWPCSRDLGLGWSARRARTPRGSWSFMAGPPLPYSPGARAGPKMVLKTGAAVPCTEPAGQQSADPQPGGRCGRRGQAKPGPAQRALARVQSARLREAHRRRSNAPLPLASHTSVRADARKSTSRIAAGGGPVTPASPGVKMKPVGFPESRPTWWRRWADDHVAVVGRRSTTGLVDKHCPG